VDTLFTLVQAAAVAQETMLDLIKVEMVVAVLVVKILVDLMLMQEQQEEELEVEVVLKIMPKDLQDLVGTVVLL
jgi:hypothetical protein